MSNNNKKDEETEKSNFRPKKHFRFQISAHARESAESFISAQSIQFEDENDDDENFHRPGPSSLPFLNVPSVPFTESQKGHFNPCFSHDEVIAIEMLAEEKKVSSSELLLEIPTNSPVPSDPDMKLIASTYLRKIEGVKEAIESGANVNSFRDRQTPLLICAEAGEVRIVAYLLQVPNINPDIANMFGETPLLIAVRNAFGEIIKLLLHHKADVNKADNMGSTPLHVALFQKRPNLAKLLLAYGADCEKPDCFGERPMYVTTVKRPHLECLLVLLRVGANPEYYDFSGLTLLSRTILNCSTYKIIRTLIRFGASVNSPDRYSRKTPLHFAAMINDVEVTKYLLTHGADANRTTINNFTPFDEAVFYKSLEVAEILLEYTKRPKLKGLNALKSELMKERE